ncbi:MAG: hypothetical protein AB8G96_03420 [Phycisphaerales bacterium]
METCNRVMSLFSAAFLAPIAMAGELHVPAEFATIQLAASAAVPGDEIILAPGRYSGDGEVVAVLPAFDIAIRGSGSGLSVVDGQGKRRGIEFPNYPDFPGDPIPLVLIEGVAFENCVARTVDDQDQSGGEWRGQGAALRIGDAIAIVQDVVFAECISEGAGAAIWHRDGELALVGVAIEDCIAATGGLVAMLETAIFDVSGFLVGRCISPQASVVSFEVGGQEVSMETVEIRQCELDSIIEFDSFGGASLVNWRVSDSRFDSFQGGGSMNRIEAMDFEMKNSHLSVLGPHLVSESIFRFERSRIFQCSGSLRTGGQCIVELVGTVIEEFASYGSMLGTNFSGLIATDSRFLNIITQREVPLIDTQLVFELDGVEFRHIGGVSMIASAGADFGIATIQNSIVSDCVVSQVVFRNPHNLGRISSTRICGSQVSALEGEWCFDSGERPEFQVECRVPCLGDVFGDGVVGFSDLVDVLAEFGRTPCVADLDDDHVVGFSDLVIVLSGWGQCY